jgi:signal peptidase I
MEDLYPLILDSFEKGLTFTFPIHGTSMVPLLHTGDLVTLEKPKDRLKKGDIALYRRENGAFVLHRVRRVQDKEYTFVGDHQYTIEKGILDSQIIGLVISYQKSGKEKTYTMKNFKYKIYKLLVRISLLRRVFGRICK